VSVAVQAQPAIAALLALPNPLDRALPAVLTARNVTGSSAVVKGVKFWIAPVGVTFGSAGSVLLGSGVLNGSDWNLNLTQARVHALVAGDYTIYAQVLDANGILSDVLSVDLSVV
jgi:hypothetical protein